MTKTIEEIHNEAAVLADRWFPDVKNYPKEKRITELALMKLITDLEIANIK
jgi:hypothetical protein